MQKPLVYEKLLIWVMAIALGLLMAATANAHQVPANQGVTIAQIDLTYDGAEQMDSRYALATVDYDIITASTGIGIGYLNIVTSEGWVVRNLPIDTSSHFPGLSVVFDLGGPGAITSLLVHTEVSELPVTSFAATPNTSYAVGSVEQNAQGRGELLGAAPAGAVNVNLVVFDPIGAINAFWQLLNPNVEQDKNQCGPASVANSLQWLENNGHITVEDEHVPGIRDGSMVGEIDKDMNRQPHERVTDGNALSGKLKYIGDEGLGNKLVCKHKNRVGSNFVSDQNLTVNGVTSTANTDVTQSLVEWIIGEIEAGEDVELAIGWPNGSGHWVRVNGGGHILGIPYITFVHDANQGSDDQGTPDEADDETDVNGGTGLLDGGLGFAFVVDDEFISFIGNGTADLALSESPKEDSVVIEKTHGSYQGQHASVDVTLETSNHEMGGFDFLVAYDASALALQSAIPGPAFYDPAPDGCGWEYFTYRYGAEGNCGDACPSGMVRVFGVAETNNGANHPSCFLPDSLPATLFTLDFLVSNDRTLECQYVPVRFFWTDCGDNTVSSVDGEVLYVSDHVYEFEGTEITDPTYGFPTYFGVQPECLNPDPDKPTVYQAVDFTNGGVDIICADSIDDRGDINLNGVVNEVADAVLYSNYFVHGISVFNVNIDGQIAASDVNADGITLSVADLVYLIRIITGDALPYPKLTPVVADADLVNGVLSVDAEMGAAYVVVESSITPLLLAESMEMKYQYDENSNLTRILVYSMEPNHSFSGDFLGGIEGNVMTLEMATYDGAPVTTKLVPDEFALYPSYPNPFNPVTTISFALASMVDYELVIYNSLGQTVKTFSDRSGPGLERIDWNASGFASGVYFYRLTAGDFTDTRKMVLLK